MKFFTWPDTVSPVRGAATGAASPDTAPPRPRPDEVCGVGCGADGAEPMAARRVAAVCGASGCDPARAPFACKRYATMSIIAWLPGPPGSVGGIDAIR